MLQQAIVKGGEHSHPLADRPHRRSFSPSPTQAAGAVLDLAWAWANRNSLVSSLPGLPGVSWPMAEQYSHTLTSSIVGAATSPHEPQGSCTPGRLRFQTGQKNAPSLGRWNWLTFKPTRKKKKANNNTAPCFVAGGTRRTPFLFDGGPCLHSWPSAQNDVKGPARKPDYWAEGPCERGKPPASLDTSVPFFPRDY